MRRVWGFLLHYGMLCRCRVCKLSCAVSSAASSVALLSASNAQYLRTSFQEFEPIKLFQCQCFAERQPRPSSRQQHA